MPLVHIWLSESLYHFHWIFYYNYSLVRDRPWDMLQLWTNLFLNRRFNIKRNTINRSVYAVVVDLLSYIIALKNVQRPVKRGTNKSQVFGNGKTIAIMLDDRSNTAVLYSHLEIWHMPSLCGFVFRCWWPQSLVVFIVKLLQMQWLSPDSVKANWTRSRPKRCVGSWPYSNSKTFTEIDFQNSLRGGNSACPGLFWSLGNQWIPFTQSRKAVSISTKSDVSNS